MPPRMLVKTDSPRLPPPRLGVIASRAKMTARNESPLMEKHQAGPSETSAQPPSIGPMTRAMLNWMEFMAMAFCTSVLGTIIGRMAW